MKKPMLALAAVGLALTLTGCGTTPVSSSSPADSAATTAPSVAVEDAAEDDTASAAPESEASDDAPVSFGQTYKYEDGLEVTVTTPKKFKPSEYAVGAEAKGTAVKFQVTLKNTGSKAYDPTLFSDTVSSGEAEAEEIFDSENGFEGSPSTSVRPGKTVKFVVGYKVLKLKDITMEVSPGFEYSEAIFTNNP
jgi:hypothetical protein